MDEGEWIFGLTLKRKKLIAAKERRERKERKHCEIGFLFKIFAFFCGYSLLCLASFCDY